MISADVDALIGLLDQEVRFFIQQEDARRALLLLGRLLDWFEREPRIAMMLASAEAEDRTLAETFRNEREGIHREVAQVWQTHLDDFMVVLGADLDSPQLNAVGSVRGFDLRCKAPAELIVPSECPRQDTTAAKDLIDCLQHWMNWTHEDAQARLGRPLRTLVGEGVTQLEYRQRHSFRRFQSACIGSAAVALARLREYRQRINVEPPPTNVSDAELGSWWGRHLDDDKFSEAIHSPGQHASTRDGRDAIEDAAGRVREDVQLIHHVLRQHFLQGWSRRVIVRRYAARCQAFAADRLRQIADEAKQPELALTRDFATYLFDQGLTPLLEANVGLLRPDVLDVQGRAVFYVEAKQYSQSPRSMLVAAYKQVWSTWGRIREQYCCPEAFLVVFRRAGPRAELPEVLQFGGLVLHSVLVDISEQAGSSERLDPIQLTPEELLPKIEG